MLEMMVAGGGKTRPGEAIFTTPGTHAFQVPPGIKEVSMVAVGAGVGNLTRGGGGGALAYANLVPVYPGDLLEVTVGTDGADSAVTGILTAAGATSYNGGLLSAGDLGGDGGDGGYYTSGYGGGGGAAGRYDTPGGMGAWGESYSYKVPNWSTIDASSDWQHRAFDEMIDGSGAQGSGALPPPSSKPLGYVICTRTGSSSSYYYYWHKRGESSQTGYRTRSGTPSGTAGQGRGGDGNEDGEGAGLMGSNITPTDNGYGYGGGRSRPGGQGAVRIIWGDERAFPSAGAGQEFSDTIETY